MTNTWFHKKTEKYLIRYVTFDFSNRGLLYAAFYVCVTLLCQGYADVERNCLPSQNMWCFRSSWFET